MRALPYVAVAVLAGAGSGCHAQVRAKANVNASAAVEEDRKYEVPEAETPIPPGVRPPPAPPPAVPVERTYFLGVAHDLSLSPSATRAPACRCLAVGYGPPSDPKFSWQIGPPQAEPGTAVVAIAADGVPCSSPGYAPLRASIAAVEREGDDVVIVVENVREGLPTVHGAIIGAPSGKGALLVRARKGAPYGAPPAGGAGPCRVPLQ